MARPTSVLAATLVFIVAVVTDRYVLMPMQTWIMSNTTGEAQVIFTFGLVALGIFITILLPVIVATQDVEKEDN